MTEDQLAAGPRARRYEIDAPVRFRRPSEEEWRHGRTVNASRTGVAFHTMDGALPSGSHLQLELRLPGPPSGAVVECTGKVVRCDALAPGLTFISMTIEVYRLAGDAGQALFCRCQS